MTQPTVAAELYVLLRKAGVERNEAQALIDAHAAAIRAAAGQHDPELVAVADIVAWLSKKAREYGGVSRTESAADALWRMADKVSRGAIRPTPARGEQH